MTDQLRLHHFEPASRANGPGIRSVLWLQGCTLGCPGCFNPLTHSRVGGSLCSTDEILACILAQRGRIEGITISGGEPLQQAAPLASLLRAVKQAAALSIVLFTGFTWTEVNRLPGGVEVLASVDVLLAGRYDAAKRIASGLLGSSNKSVHFLTPHYTQADLDRVPEAEIIIQPNGEVRFSGIEPLQW
jgi:anaerobic ribonucleoside-triphosphate reductase activating protein